MLKKRSKKRAVHETETVAQPAEETPLPDLNSMVYCSFIDSRTGAGATPPVTTSSMFVVECQDGASSGSCVGAAAGTTALPLPAPRCDKGEEGEEEECEAEEEEEEEDDDVDLSWSDQQRYHLQCLGAGIGLLALAVLLRRRRYLVGMLVVPHT